MFTGVDSGWLHDWGHDMFFLLILWLCWTVRVFSVRARRGSRTTIYSTCMRDSLHMHVCKISAGRRHVHAIFFCLVDWYLQSGRSVELPGHVACVAASMDACCILMCAIHINAMPTNACWIFRHECMCKTSVLTMRANIKISFFTRRDCILCFVPWYSCMHEHRTCMSEDILHMHETAYP